MFKSEYDKNNNSVVDLSEQLLGYELPENNNKFWSVNGWETIIIPEVDLSNYYTKDETNQELNNLDTQLSQEILESSVFESGIVNRALGGLPLGYILTGKTVIEVMTDLLIQFIPPTSAFSFISFVTTGGQTSGNNLEKGFGISRITVGRSIVQNSDTFIASEITQLLHPPRTNSLLNSTEVFDFVSPVTSFTGNTYTITQTNNFQISNDIINQVNINFIPPRFFGMVSNSFLSQDIITMPKANLSGTKNASLNFTPNDNRFMYAYPSRYGLLTSVKDVNNFQFIDNFILRTPKPIILFADGSTEEYNVYVYNSDVAPSPSALTYIFE